MRIRRNIGVAAGNTRHRSIRARLRALDPRGHVSAGLAFDLALISGDQSPVRGLTLQNAQMPVIGRV